jgi:hypothetical protein
MKLTSSVFSDVALYASESQPALRRNTSPPISAQKTFACYLPNADFLLGLFLDPEQGRVMFFQNVGRFSMGNMV